MRYQGYNPTSSLSSSKLSSYTDTILESLALLHTAGLILKHQHRAQSLNSLYPALMDMKVYIQWRSQLFKEKLNILQGIDILQVNKSSQTLVVVCNKKTWMYLYSPQTEPDQKLRNVGD